MFIVDIDSFWGTTFFGTTSRLTQCPVAQLDEQDWWQMYERLFEPDAFEEHLLLLVRIEHSVQRCVPLHTKFKNFAMLDFLGSRRHASPLFEDNCARVAVLKNVNEKRSCHTRCKRNLSLRSKKQELEGVGSVLLLLVWRASRVNGCLKRYAEEATAAPLSNCLNTLPSGVCSQMERYSGR